MLLPSDITLSLVSLEAVRLKSQCVDSLRRVTGGNPPSVCQNTSFLLGPQASEFIAFGAHIQHG